MIGAMVEEDILVVQNIFEYQYVDNNIFFEFFVRPFIF